MSRTHEAPGEMGKAVIIPKEDQDKMKELFKINQFNLMASDMIALNRSLPDVRLDGWACVCLHRQMLRDHINDPNQRIQSAAKIPTTQITINFLPFVFYEERFQERQWQETQTKIIFMFIF